MSKRNSSKAPVGDAPPSPSVWAPRFRRLRVYAFDPSLAIDIDTAVVNQITLHALWESGAGDGKSSLQPGPIGEYLEVIDYDPASGCFYQPVDLDDPHLLATDGFAPSEGNPQFHQQMVYAVAMNTIDHFEQALGRRALWASHQMRDAGGRVRDEQFVRRLRIYPHALREANAYYSPDKKALLFGYFPASADDPGKNLPGGIVFTCLSHDIVAHETSHALLDGMHRRFAEPTNPDVLAFHEAFADMVALFEHFSHPQVLRHEIARTRGDLGSQNMLGQLAQQFGQAVGRHGALRDALGKVDPKTKQWIPTQPDPQQLDRTLEPHQRGAILVAAAFDAFIAIYKSRIADLVRIATQGTGVLTPGALHADLVNRMAREASTAATHLLRVFIRALDYCPPVDMTLGDYLRAVVTADIDLVPDDDHNYRLAIIEAFRQWGIYPRDVRSLSVESLVWRPPRIDHRGLDVGRLFDTPGQGKLLLDWAASTDRKEIWQDMRANAAVVHRWLTRHCSLAGIRELGLTLDADAPRSIYRHRLVPQIEVHSVRLARRMAPRGRQVTDLVIEIMQRRRGYVDPDQQRKVDRARRNPSDTERGEFTFRGGCTLLVNPETQQIRYAITKHILSDRRLDQQRQHMAQEEPSLRATYFSGSDDQADEPFAILHRGNPM